MFSEKSPFRLNGRASRGSGQLRKSALMEKSIRPFSSGQRRKNAAKNMRRSNTRLSKLPLRQSGQRTFGAGSDWALCATGLLLSSGRLRHAGLHSATRRLVAGLWNSGLQIGKQAHVHCHACILACEGKPHDVILDSRIYLFFLGYRSSEQFKNVARHHDPPRSRITT